MSTLSAGTKQRIDADGFAVIAGVLGYREMDTLKADMHKMPLHRSRAGARHMLGNASVAALASDPKLLEIARQILGYEARPFRATLFDKSPSSNWLVVWHQDHAPSVSREAMRGLTEVLHLITGERLWKAFAAATEDHVRRDALFLIARLSKWESIGYLVEALDNNAEDLRKLAESYLRRWYAQFNSSFTAPQTAS